MTWCVKAPHLHPDIAFQNDSSSRLAQMMPIQKVLPVNACLFFKMAAATQREPSHVAISDR